MKGDQFNDERINQQHPEQPGEPIHNEQSTYHTRSNEHEDTMRHTYTTPRDEQQYTSVRNSEYTAREVYGKEKNNHTFLKMLAAGVLGSALTLGAVNLPFFDGMNNDAKSGTVYDVKDKKEVTNLSQMLESVSPAVVGIINEGSASSDIFNTSDNESNINGTGSGVIYSVKGNEAYIVTNNHVIENSNALKVRLSTGEDIDAKLIGTDPLTDIAVLKITTDASIKPISFANSSQIHIGDPVYAIGNPLGLDLTGSVTEGIVSAKEREMTVKTSAGNSSVKVIQTDAAINPGNSGGALINNKGELIGINTLKISSDAVEGIGFAIPSNDVRTIIDQLVKHGSVERPYMGLSLVSLESVPEYYLQEMHLKEKTGVLVVRTDEYAGKTIEKGDIIKKVDDQEVQNDSELRSYIYEHKKEGDEVEFTVIRDGKEKKVSLQLRSTSDK